MKLFRMFSAPRIVLAALVFILLALVQATPTGAQGPWYGSRVYIVQYGDTLSSIAARFGVPLQALIQANSFAPPYYPGVGRQIYLPYGSPGYGRGYGPMYAPPGYGQGYNTPSPMTPAAAPPYSATTGTITYQVQFGDTLFSIARRFGVSVNDIVALNNIYNPNLIYAGTTLKIPQAGTNPPPGQTLYIVQWGDTLFRIAIRFGTTVYAIQIANNIPNPNLIYAGQRLVIPTGSTFPTPTNTPAAAPSATPGNTPASAPSATATATAIATATVTATNAPTPSLTPGVIVIPAPVVTNTPTNTLTPAPAPTLVPPQTNTPLPTATFIPPTPFPTLTNTPLPTATPLPLPTNTPLPTGTPIPPTPRPLPTNTPLPTATLIPPTPVPPPTSTPLPPPTNTPLPPPTNTPLPTATPIPPSPLPPPTNTPLATATSITPTASPSDTATPLASATPGGSVSVSIKNTAYNPNTLLVRAGTTVIWTNDETNRLQHTVTSGTLNAATGMFDSGNKAPGQTFQFTFNTPGTFPYYCRIHGNAMTGTVTVLP